MEASEGNNWTGHHIFSWLKIATFDKLIALNLSLKCFHILDINVFILLLSFILLDHLIFQKSDTKPKLLASSSAPSNKPVNVECAEEDFYTMLERINANALSEKDMKRFIAAMKEVSVSDLS